MKTFQLTERVSEGCAVDSSAQNTGKSIAQSSEPAPARSERNTTRSDIGPTPNAVASAFESKFKNCDLVYLNTTVVERQSVLAAVKSTLSSFVSIILMAVELDTGRRLAQERICIGGLSKMAFLLISECFAITAIHHLDITGIALMGIFDKNKGKMKLHKHTRVWIEKQLLSDCLRQQECVSKG